jgi:hypothetical protein
MCLAETVGTGGAEDCVEIRYKPFRYVWNPGAALK